MKQKVEIGNNQELFSSNVVLYNVVCNRIDNPVGDTGFGNYFIVETKECPEKVEIRDHVENPRKRII